MVSLLSAFRIISKHRCLYTLNFIFLFVGCWGNILIKSCNLLDLNLMQRFNWFSKLKQTRNNNHSLGRLFIQGVLCSWFCKSSQNSLLLAYHKFMLRFCLVLHSLLSSSNGTIKNYNVLRVRDVLGAFCAETSPRNLKSDHWFRKLDIIFHNCEGDRCGPVMSDRLTCSRNMIIICTSFIITYFDIGGVFVCY